MADWDFPGPFSPNRGDMTMADNREGSLEAPTRHPLDWKNPGFYDEEKLFAEMERVFDICHGCRRCVSLCHAFPTLFDLVDESDTMEVDGVKKEDYWKVVEHCYLCDLCFLTKCPYVPPHEWNVDFPHLMLQAKAVHYKKHGAKFRDRLLSATDTVPRLAGIPIVAGVVNAMNHTGGFRKVLEKTLGVDSDADSRLHQQAAAQPPEAQAGRPGRAGGPHHRQGGAVRHLLRQPQPA
jgi:ferredoxin